MVGTLMLTDINGQIIQTVKETVALNDTPDQMDLIDIFRGFHPK